MVGRFRLSAVPIIAVAIMGVALLSACDGETPEPPSRGEGMARSSRDVKGDYATPESAAMEEGAERSRAPGSTNPAEKLKEKMTLGQVKKLLGEPKKISKASSGDATMRKWRYADGLVLTFLNGKLDKWEHKKPRERRSREKPSKAGRSRHRRNRDDSMEFKPPQPAPF